MANIPPLIPGDSNFSSGVYTKRLKTEQLITDVVDVLSVNVSNISCSNITSTNLVCSDIMSSNITSTNLLCSSIISSNITSTEVISTSGTFADLSVSNGSIYDLSTPINNRDAANKEYVDTSIAYPITNIMSRPMLLRTLTANQVLNGNNVYWCLSQTNSGGQYIINLPSSIPNSENVISGNNVVPFWLQAVGNSSSITFITGSNLNITFDGSISAGTIVIPQRSIGSFAVQSPAPGLFRIFSLGISPVQ